MSLIKQLCEKYGGTYSADDKKGVRTTEGVMKFQFRKGEFLFEGEKIEIRIDEMGGSAYGTNPYQLILTLENPSRKTFRIHPKYFIDKVVDVVLRRKTKFIPKPLRGSFQLTGDRELVEKVMLDHHIGQLMLGQKFTSFIEEKNPNKLVLCPSRGIRNLEEAELFVGLLKRIGDKV